MGLTPMRIVYRDEVIDQRTIAGELPATGDQVSVNGRWYTVLERYWHWLGGPMVEIAVSPPSELTQSHKDLEAYRAGREDAARDIEAAVVAGAAIPAWATPSGVPTARAFRAWAASLARGNQPRTIQESSPSEHTQDGGE